MKKFKGKVAVITGAASGIGKAIADHCFREGMKVVLADIAEDRLSEVEREYRNQGFDLLADPCDVAKYEDVENLAKETVREFGKIHLLFNNAGVGTVGDIVKPLWEASDDNWELITNVNLWGAINVIRIFLPIMLNQDTECHIVNTSSSAGLLSGNAIGIYRMTKAAIINLSETLQNQLVDIESKIRVSVLCPYYVRTNVAKAALKRHKNLQKSNLEESLNKEDREMVKGFLGGVQSGISPSEVAEITFKGIRDERFYISTHPEIKEEYRAHLEGILDQL